ncbi:AAA family ATPase [Enterococcus sp. N342-3-1-2]
MVKVLLTGMSGVGKSTILDHIRSSGHQCIDLDYNDWIIFDDTVADYLMDTNKIIRYIEAHPNEPLFFAGTTINQKEIYPSLDWVILLTAPIDVMHQRIQNRSNNQFGKSETEWTNILKDKETVEPLLMQSCDRIVSTDQSIDDVVRDIYTLIGF